MTYQMGSHTEAEGKTPSIIENCYAVGDGQMMRGGCSARLNGTLQAFDFMIWLQISDG